MARSYGGISGAVLVRQLPPYIPASSAAPKCHFLKNRGRKIAPANEKTPAGNPPGVSVVDIRIVPKR
jgi:hypothetical protein